MHTSWRLLKNLYFLYKSEMTAFPSSLFWTIIVTAKYIFISSCVIYIMTFKTTVIKISKPKPHFFSKFSSLTFYWNMYIQRLLLTCYAFKCHAKTVHSKFQSSVNLVIQTKKFVSLLNLFGTQFTNDTEIYLHFSSVFTYYSIPQ